MAINLTTLTDPTSAAAEAYRRLRVNLLAAGKDAPLQTILVVAVGADPEKAGAVAHLAVTFAKVSKRVILADCDLHHPAQHTIFGLDNRAGVTTALTAPPPQVEGQSTPQEPVLRSPRPEGEGSLPKGREAGEDPLPLRDTEVPGLRVLTSGPAVGVPSDLIASPGMSALIGRLRAEADIVLFDAPPVLLATDAVELATQVDGVLLTVRAGHTRRNEAQRAKELLAQVGARVVGAVLT